MINQNNQCVPKSAAIGSANVEHLVSRGVAGSEVNLYRSKSTRGSVIHGFVATMTSTVAPTTSVSCKSIN